MLAVLDFSLDSFNSYADDWHNLYTNASVDWQPHLRPDELSDPDMDSLAAFGPAAVHAARTKVKMVARSLLQFKSSCYVSHS